MKKKVAIIGAGPAGLTAAYELLSRFGDEYEVCIIDKDTRIGGLAKTVPCNGFRVDLGGHRYFSKNPRIVTWWQQVIPEGQLLNVSRSSQIIFHGNLIDYPLTLSRKTIHCIGLMSAAKIICSYIKTRIKPVDERSLEGFYINRFGESLYRLFFADYTEKLWGRSADRIPSDWGYQRVKGLSIAKALRNAIQVNKRPQEISLTDHFYYPCMGSGYLWEQAAEKIRSLGGQFMLSCTVRELQTEKNQIRRLRLGNGTEVAADMYFSSIPLQELVSSIPEVPNEIKEISEDLVYRDFVLVGLLLHKEAIFGKALEKHNGELIDSQWLYIQDTSVKMGRIQIFNRWSSCMISSDDDVVLGVEYFCQSGDADWNMMDSEWTALALSELKREKMIRSDAGCRDAVVCRVEKAYPCYWGGYQKLEQLRLYLNGIDNLCCIGRNGQHRYNNTDHSMETAFLAVDYLRGIVTKEKIWQVNTDPDYHEEKE